ncbi:MAG: right-handed parallel beta-helix repeat-containing protein, partial [Lachnospiraceae bacterium]|nr:right-handed parallel beta-helix repeat-containing protein [Lachnospiraceae bacterium]
MRMRKTGKQFCGMLLLFAALLLCIGMPAEAKSYKTYKISASTKPYTNAYQKRAKADKTRSTTYMLKSYLDLIDKKGGGTLVFRKGTYNIYENLYIPSNTTLKFEKGVKIVAKKGVAGVFNLIPPSKTGKKNWAKKYASSKNVKFVGNSNVVFDLGSTSATAIYMTHNQNVTVENIQFKKNNSSRYMIELNGVKNVTIKNCDFIGTSAQKTSAVSVDVPAKKRAQTKSWSSNDDTLNQKVTIENCKFDKLNRAIVTLRYVSKKYNTDFKVTGNQITNIKDDAIRAINWKKFSVTANTFKNVASGGSIATSEGKLKRAVYLAGAASPTITGNTFENVPRAIEFNIYTNTDTKLKSYAATVNTVTNAELQSMLNGNTIVNNREYVIRVYKAQGGDSDRYWYPDDTETFYVTPDDTPYRNVYLNYTDYNKTTRQYYA